MTLEINSAIAELPKMTWRGLDAPPYDSASFSGSFSLAERRYPYIPGASHESVGRDPMPMSFRLHFLNNLGKDYFPKLFEKWFNAVALDPSVGMLTHPIMGAQITALVRNWSVDVSADRTSGATLEVSFIETTTDPANTLEPLLQVDMGAILASAKAADQDYSNLELPWPDGTGETSLLGMLKKLDGMVTMARGTAEGYINQSLGTVEAVIDTAESIGDNAKWALLGNLITVWNGLKDLADKAGIESRVIASLSIVSPTNIDRVAGVTGNSVGELIGLNPGLIDGPKIGAGSVVLYYADKKFNAEVSAASGQLGV